MASHPMITPAPEPVAIELRAAATPINPATLANLMATALPVSLRELAATNIPAVSRALWSEFLDGKTPSWFAALPTDVQQYLSSEYGPSTASATSTTEESSSTSAASATAQATTGDAQSDSSLSTGQKIGIGVGAALGVLLIVALVVCACLLLRRRRRRRRSRGSMHEKFGRPATPMSFTGDRDGYGHKNAIVDSGSTINASGDYGQGLPQPTPVYASSRRNSRGSRVSFTSLHSVQEEAEPEIARSNWPLTGSNKALPNNGLSDLSKPATKDLGAAGLAKHNGINGNGQQIRRSSSSEFANGGSPAMVQPSSPLNRSVTAQRDSGYSNAHSFGQPFSPKLHSPTQTSDLSSRDADVLQYQHSAFRKSTSSLHNGYTTRDSLLSESGNGRRLSNGTFSKYRYYSDSDRDNSWGRDGSISMYDGV